MYRLPSKAKPFYHRISNQQLGRHQGEKDVSKKQTSFIQRVSIGEGNILKEPKGKTIYEVPTLIQIRGIMKSPSLISLPSWPNPSDF